MHQLNVLVYGPHSFLITLNELKPFLKFNHFSDFEDKMYDFLARRMDEAIGNVQSSFQFLLNCGMGISCYPLPDIEWSVGNRKRFACNIDHEEILGRMQQLIEREFPKAKIGYLENISSDTEQWAIGSFDSIYSIGPILQQQITIEKTDALACLNNDWMHLEKLDLENYLMMRNTYEAKMRNIIEQGIQQKELQERNIDLVLFSLLSTLRTLHLWYSKNKEVSPQLLFEEMKQNLLHGIIR